MAVYGKLSPYLSFGTAVALSCHRQTKQELFTRLAGALHENKALNKENDKWAEQPDRQTARKEALKQENKSLHDDLLSYRQVIDDKSSKCRKLKKQLEELRQASLSNNRGPSWGIANLFPAVRDDQRPSDATINAVRSDIAEYKKHV
ncbi:hypothetical protein N657DRAFT_632157 [Parathielavia appendiculata]|uniref:Uncharacterized protein n=1 Tax=Parathielavia appendiculata TaxID=2587402 RepID=A0AAN6Z529_9PEZI|nr:hypothetical protein N657DRAFT_632157 [Parathielavia appendiculata]